MARRSRVSLPGLMAAGGHMLKRPYVERTERMDFASLIIGEGDRATAPGRLVRDENRRLV